MGILWTLLIGFLAGIIAKFLPPGPFGEAHGWKCSLENKPWGGSRLLQHYPCRHAAWDRHRPFPLDPIKALFWSAVINGFVAVPVMAAMMRVGSRRDQMGRFTVGPLTLALGWVTTAVMAVAALRY